MTSPTTLIRAVTVVDGTGESRYTADVELADGVIRRIARPGSLEPGAADVIEGAGLVLSPGFIDMHAHSDLQLLIERDHYAKLSQGVTTELLGQDGLSYAPVDETSLDLIRKQIAGWNTNPDDFDWDWRTVGEYLDRLDRPDADGQRIATNAAYLIPQGTLRALVVGFDDRPATADQVAEMQRVIAAGMAEGAIGLSAGLTYTPGMYAGTAELEALLTTVGQLGGFFDPHHRSYGKGALEGYAEMIALSRATGCPLHLAHATMNFGVNKGRAGELLALIDEALAEGADITLDTYPYLPGATTLAAVLPSWSASGGIEATIERLRDPDTRARIRQALEVDGSDGCHGVVAEWETLEISGVQNPDLDDLVGKTVEQIAAERGESEFDTFCDILIRDRCGTGILQHVGHEENVRQIMVHRVHTGGSDGLLVGGKPHPQAWGTFPRYLGHYCRELGLLGLEETVHHLTGRPAARLNLVDRGLIRQGYAADLVLFDPDTIADTATYPEPRQPAAGIHHVFVNGVPAIADGRPTGARAGRALRRTTRGTAPVGA